MARFLLNKNDKFLNQFESDNKNNEGVNEKPNNEENKNNE